MSRKQSRKKSVRRMNRSLSMESLESRQLLAAGVSLSNGTLNIVADARGGEVDVSEERGIVTVTMGSGRAETQKIYPSWFVRRIAFLGSNRHDDFENNTRFPATIHGRGGNDTLKGGSARDTIFGGLGTDTIHGRGDNDILYGDEILPFGMTRGSGNDTIHGGSGDDKIYGMDGNDTIHGNDGNDTIEGGNGNDVVSGGAKNDKIRGQAGRDTLKGDGGQDWIYGGTGVDIINGGDASDWLWGEGGDDDIWGGDDVARDIIVGGAGGDDLYGGPGGDSLFGDGFSFYGVSSGTGADTIEGGDGNDYIHGGGGDDDIKGQGDDDRIWGEGGRDTLEGGAGNDIIWGGSGEDDLYGHNGRDTLHGGTENDDLFGGGDADQLNGDEGADTLAGDGGADVLRGGAGDDTLEGGHGNDDLNGEAGNDSYLFTIVGHLGHDQISDSAAGFFSFLAGQDTLDFSGTNTGINLDLQLTTRQNVHRNLDLTLGSSLAFERVFGSRGNDTIRGNLWANRLEGRGGNDHLEGRQGGDTLLGGYGGDELRGGAGKDVLNGGFGGDELYGGSENDILRGNQGDDTLWGGSGDDSLYGHQGDDTLIGQGDHDTYHFDADNHLGTDTIQDPNYEFSTLDFSSTTTRSITVDANEQARQVINDRLALVLDCERGRYTIIGGTKGDDITAMRYGSVLKGGPGNDVLRSSDGRLEGGPGNDTLYGTNGGNVIFVFDADRQLGTDTIVSPGGATFDFWNTSSKEIIFDLNNEEPQRVNSNLTIDLERGSDGTNNSISGWYKVLGGAKDDVITGYRDATWNSIRGNTGDDVLFGGDRRDTLDGEDGDDTLYGGRGDDDLEGGLGKDTLYGQGDNDSLAGDFRQDDEGSDHAYDHYIEFDDGDFKGMDNGDELYGGGGDDQLYGELGDDHLDGGVGNNTLRGGPGCDTIVGADGVSNDCEGSLNGPQILELRSVVIDDNNALIEWEVECGSSCQISLDHVGYGGDRSGLAKKGTVDVKRDRNNGLDGTYILTVRSGDVTVSAEVSVPAWIAPGSGVSVYYFKLTNSSSRIRPCFTYAVTASSEQEARTIAQAQASNYTVTSISQEEYNQGC